ncbi:hypothetical protein F4802DRAFT_65642 [Xylaria palmicola]|nr:hypothetical protein F4802DRAFT_65642 [Xylaria palmicola]
MDTTIPNTMLGTRNEPRQSPLLMMLPVEMILSIADQTTSAADAMSLALTCKALFTILSKYSFKRLDAHSRELLLANLERDISWVVYCPVARKLLPFYSSENGFVYPAAPNIHQLFIPNDSYYIWSMCPGKNPLISFLETRLVRNRRLFGPTHGIPLSCLSLTAIKFSTCRFMWTRHRMFLDTSRTARWIGENLFLSSTWIVRVMGVVMAGRVIPTKSLRDLLTNIPLKFACYHCSFLGTPNSTYGVLYPSFDKAAARLSENLAYEGRGSCSVCDTDWDVSISWLNHSLVFKLIKYHDLGCCSIPPDPKWVRLLNHNSYEAMRSSPREVCHGYVRHKWINSG